MQHAIAGLLCASAATAVFAQEVTIQARPIKSPITINVNGNKIETPLVAPILVDGRVMVPLRGVLQEFDVEIEWFAKEKVVVARGNGRAVTLPIGMKYGIVKDMVMPLEVPARIVNGRTLVPLRFVAEALNAYVMWHEADRTVVITSRIDSDGAK
jgi:hypothetical protein